MSGAKPDRWLISGSIMLRDSFGRILDYLRVSVTDRCNLRCVYCMPPQGVPWKPHGSMLSFEEILRLCRIMADLGIRKIKLTGGEPLVRRGMAAFFGSLRAVPGIEKLSLTTNGLLLGAFLDEAGALPTGVNISLNALNPERYALITRGAGPAEVLSNIDRLLEKQIPVKINSVPIRGFNEEEIIPLALLARDRNISVRFIELMPLGSARNLTPISGDETSSIIEKAFGRLTPFSGIQGSGPAVYYSLSGFNGKIGFINPVSRGFCETCNRLRLTSEGFLKPCLSSSLFINLRDPLRSGASGTELSRLIREAADKKPQFHTLSPVYGELPAEAERLHSAGMSGIGG